MIRLARVAATVLVGALFFAVGANAAVDPAQRVHLDRTRLFDRSSESLFAAIVPQAPLSSVGVAVFNVAAQAQPLGVPAIAADGSAAPRVHLALPDATAASFAPAAAAPKMIATAPAVPNIAVAASAPLEAVPDASGSAADPLPPAPVHFGAYAPYLPSLSSGTLSQSVSPVRLDADAFRSMATCGTTDEAAPCANANGESGERLAAQSNVLFRVANTPVRLQFSGSVERLTASAATFPYVPLSAGSQQQADFASPDLPAASLYYPGVSTMQKTGAGAALSVPLARRVTLGLQYDTMHYAGSYGVLSAQALDAQRQTYMGGVTYQIPNTTGALTLSAGQNRLQNVFAPNVNLTQTNADLNFTVKF